MSYFQAWNSKSGMLTRMTMEVVDSLDVRAGLTGLLAQHHMFSCC